MAGVFFGFVFFLTMAMCGFWCLTYLIHIIAYWLTVGIAENNGRINADVDPETVRRKKMFEQEGVTLLYRK